MAAPQLDIGAFKRVPFDYSIAIMGVDYTGASLAMQIRTEPGNTGTPLVDLASASPPSQGLSVTYDADYPDPDGKLPDGASLIRIIISEATLEGLPAASDTTKPLELFYDIHVTPSGGTKGVFCGGRFVINPGVTV
jgi:hypothetical protein